jgi:ribose 5-phosphate isomerase
VGNVVATGAVVTAGANVVADVTAGMVDSVIGVVADFDGDAGVVPHGAIVAEAHDAESRFLIRPNSL